MLRHIPACGAAWRRKHKAGASLTLSKISWAGSWLPVLRRLPSPSTDRQEVALSIDDGPSPSTLEILDTLRRSNAKATFFLSGCRLMERPDIIQTILDDGHQIFGHGLQHIPLDKTNSTEIIRTLSQAESILAAHRPTPNPYLVRLPYAAGRRKSWVHRAIRKWSASAQIAHWELSAEDHTIAPNCISTDDILHKCRMAVKRVLASENLNGSVILLHDHPFGIESPFVPDVTRTMIELLVNGLTHAGYAIVPMQPYQHAQPLLSKYVLHG